MVRYLLTSPKDLCCLHNALEAVERYWGVQLAVSHTIAPLEGLGTQHIILVDCLKEIHKQELNGFEGISVEMLSSHNIPLELQMIGAIQLYLIRLDEHMRQ